MTQTPLNRKGARDFLFSYFYADYLQNMESVEDAVQEYLDEGSDPEGELLCNEVQERWHHRVSSLAVESLIDSLWPFTKECKNV